MSRFEDYDQFWDWFDRHQLCPICHKAPFEDSPSRMFCENHYPEWIEFTERTIKEPLEFVNTYPGGYNKCSICLKYSMQNDDDYLCENCRKTHYGKE
jgi:hypothetical protein